MLKKEIMARLDDWDGKSANAIRATLDRYAETEGLTGAITELLKVGTYQVGASWLLKNYLDEKEHVPAEDAVRIFDALPVLEGWETKLHILQSLHHLSINVDHVDVTERFLRQCLADKNKFVRAWAYSGFFHLAQQHNQYLEEVNALLGKAMSEEAPSVKARIRRIVKGK